MGIERAMIDLTFCSSFISFAMRVRKHLRKWAKQIRRKCQTQRGKLRGRKILARNRELICIIPETATQGMSNV